MFPWIQRFTQCCLIKAHHTSAATYLVAKWLQQYWIHDTTGFGHTDDWRRTWSVYNLQEKKTQLLTSFYQVITFKNISNDQNN